MSIIDELREQNPWWLDPLAIQSDPHIRDLKAQPFIRNPKILSQIDLKSPKLYTLRGPRQVGKTSLVKTIIRDLLAHNIPAQRIIYYSLDLVLDYKQIVEIVRTAKDYFSDIKGQRYIFLDEISSVSNWQKAIKYIRDLTLGKDDFYLLTGSSARDMRRGAERLPGRRSGGSDKILLPMSFKEFLNLRYPKIPVNNIPISEFFEKKSNLLFKKGMLYLKDLEKCLEEYAKIGGFPRAVASYVKNGEISFDVFQLFWAVLAGDVERWDRDRIMALKLFERLKLSIGSVLSWNSIAEATGFASPVTAEEYVEILAEEFSLLVLYFFDLSKRSISPKKGKKIYFTDPLFYHLTSQIIKGNTRYKFNAEELSRIIENICAIELFSSIEKDKVESFSAPQNLFYWRSSSQKEIDFLVRSGNKILPIEIKYKENISRQELLTINNSFGRGLVLSRNTLSINSPIKIIPLPIFLWLLKSS